MFGLGNPFARGTRHFEMRDRSVFISGGSRGLGLELARVFGARGARVAVAGRDPAELERARSDLNERGVRALTIVADMRHKAESERALETARAQFGTVDILVNNLGIIAVGPLESQTEDDYRDAMDTHFWSSYYAIENVAPHMRARRSGRIVNITSIGGRISVPHLLPYCASKFALIGYSEGLRSELIRDRVYVTTVVPGLMRTGSPENAMFKGRHKLEYAWFTISDSLPFLSVDVKKAAQLIVDATERGDAELTISVPAVLASLVHGVFPAAVCDVLGVVARVLPSSGGIGRNARRGRDSHSAVSPSPLTASTQHRAETQNQESTR
jgi:NAD(P)-dependent dehydrogenase (short-subunit alcohol dehydrogenase family)